MKLGDPLSSICYRSCSSKSTNYAVVHALKRTKPCEPFSVYPDTSIFVKASSSISKGYRSPHAKRHVDAEVPTTKCIHRLWESVREK
jgi:hypothetical protein